VAGSRTREVSRAAFRLGVLYQQAGDHARAVEQYRAQLAAEPWDVATLNNLGVSLRHLGQLAEAADALERALAIEPGYDKALTNLGVVRQLLDRSEAAMEAHLRALAVNGRSWESALNLGLLLWEAQDVERAAHFFRTVLSLRRNGTAAYHLGVIAERQGRSQDGVELYRQALQTPESLPASLRIGTEERLRALLGQVRR
jgi:tetratricopeptide (TPR) repeat protein